MQDIKDLQQKLLEMISDLDSFCKENDIDYVLCGGNVLGAVRHKGFIPWDDDLDIQMPRESYNRFLELFKENDKYIVQKDTEDYPLQFSKFRAKNTTFIEDIPYKKKYRKIHQGIYIDIFPVDKVSTKRSQTKKQVLFSNILIAQSLFLRGYPKSHRNFKKNIFLFLSIFLLPFRNYFNNYVKSFNNITEFDYYCSFYGTTNKIFQKKSNFEKPFTKLQFENLKLPVMKDYIKFLEDAYGDYMKLPTESERNYTVHAKYFSTTEDYISYLRKI